MRINDADAARCYRLLGHYDQLVTLLLDKLGGTFDATVVTLPVEGIALKELERLAIVQALERTDYVQNEAAALLQISARTLSYKLTALGIPRKGYARAIQVARAQRDAGTMRKVGF